MARVRTAPFAARLATLRDLRALLAGVPGAGRAAPFLMLLGLFASLAETAGISLVILFLYAAMGQLDGGAIGQTFGRPAAWMMGVLGGPVQLAGAIFGLIVLRGLLSFAYMRISSALSARISEAARNAIHRQYLDVSYEFIRSRQQAELMDVLGNDSWAVATAYGAFTRVIINFCAIIVFGIFLFALSWQITLVAAVCGILVSLFIGRFSRPVPELAASVKAEHQEMSELMLMTLEGMRAIRAYGREEAQHKSFLQSSASARGSLVRLERLSAAIHPVTEIGSLAILCVIVLGANALRIDFHTTLTIVALLYRLQPHLRELAANLLHLDQVAPQIHAAREMMDPAGKSFPRDGAQPMPADLGSITFDGVSFAYDGKPALIDVSFSIPANRVTALVGASGSGKTTIVNLLLRLYQPDRGGIVVGGVPLDDVRRAEWLHEIAVAGQDIDLVEGTVRDNILMAYPGADAAAISDAYAVSGLTDLIASLEYGDDEWIGHQGLNLSGGQRQRVGIARAILRNPSILILDEATSALDGGLEARIRAAIEDRFAGRTILIITHRLETVRNVDHVICLADGRVKAAGKPGDVLDHVL